MRNTSDNGIDNIKYTSTCSSSLLHEGCCIRHVIRHTYLCNLPKLLFSGHQAVNAICRRFQKIYTSLCKLVSMTALTPVVWRPWSYRKSAGDNLRHMFCWLGDNYDICTPTGEVRRSGTIRDDPVFRTETVPVAQENQEIGEWLWLNALSALPLRLN